MSRNSKYPPPPCRLLPPHKSTNPKRHTDTTANTTGRRQQQQRQEESLGGNTGAQGATRSATRSIKLICLPYVVMPALIALYGFLTSTVGRLFRLWWSALTCKCFRYNTGGGERGWEHGITGRGRGATQDTIIARLFADLAVETKKSPFTAFSTTSPAPVGSHPATPASNSATPAVCRNAADNLNLDFGIAAAVVATAATNAGRAGAPRRSAGQGSG